MLAGLQRKYLLSKLPEFTHASSRKSARSYLKLGKIGAKKTVKVIAYKLEKKFSSFQIIEILFHFHNRRPRKGSNEIIKKSVIMGHCQYLQARTLRLKIKSQSQICFLRKVSVAFT